VKLLPWQYLFLPFNSRNFHDLFYPIALGSLVLLAILVILYNVRTRQLRGHAPYLDLYEWLLWTGVITFSLLLVEAVFVFYFLFVIVTLGIGLAVFLWVRFIHFPPTLAVYEQKLARQRYFSRLKYAHPESTIRSKSTIRPNRRRRSGARR
jgi:hypothetical protein